MTPICVLRSLTMAAILFVFIAGCSHQTSPTTFLDPVPTAEKPWSPAGFDNDPNTFTFALFSDLTGGERPDVFNIAIAQLALLRPELIVNVGDLTEGSSSDRRLLEAQWQDFHSRANRASTRIFYTGGNHDLANVAQRDVWRAKHGPRYYHFVYKDVLFLVLDTEDHPRERLQQIDQAYTQAMAQVAREGWGNFGSTAYARMEETRSGAVSMAQADYFTQAIQANPDVRWTFVLMHKPAWRRDNELHFGSIETALAAQPYTVFFGHNHFYAYEQRLGRDYIQLGTTGGVQFADKPLSIDHVSLVTVSDTGIDIANIKLSGIFDKTGHLPLQGDVTCFDVSECGEKMQP